jgi:3-oxoacid CoA-transferase subunit A
MGFLHDGMLIAAGGFGLCGIPELLIAASRRGRQGPDRRLEQCGRGRFRPRQAAADQADQEDDVVLRGRKRRVHAPVPVGRAGAGVQPAGHAGRTHARRRRGHPRVLHQDRRRHRDRRGQGVRSSTARTYILERGIFADLAIVKAWKADATGNAIFRKTARNFNPPAAMCGKVCVMEVEEIVPNPARTGPRRTSICRASTCTA